MEPDRYTHHQKIFIAGISCLVLAIAFFFFSLYILPFLIWRLNYQVPAFIIMMQAYFQDSYQSTFQANLIIWLIFFIPSLITGFMAYYFSNKIEDQIYRYETSTEEEEKIEEKKNHNAAREEMKESAGLAFKIISLMIGIVIVILILQFVVAG